jgi:branched-chain amino acid transport system permease protein
MDDLYWRLVDFLQAFAAGLLVGGTYGLMCVGLGIIFGVMRVVNFAHGDFMMLGMYAAFYLVTGFGVLAFLGPMPGRSSVRCSRADRVRDWLAAAQVPHLARHRRSRHLGRSRRALRADHPHARHRAGAGERRPDPVRIDAALGTDAALARILGDRARVPQSGRAVGFIMAAICATGLYLFLTRTNLGKALRAAADNPIAAAYVGIDVDRAHRLAFGLGVGITGVAGGLFAMSQSFQPYIGFDFVIVMYAGVVLGGMGSILGAFWGGLTIGLVQQMSTLILPYQLQNTAIFVVFLIIVFFRPQGMFGRVWERT